MPLSRYHRSSRNVLRRHHRLEVAVRRRDDADVDPARRGRPPRRRNERCSMNVSSLACAAGPGRRSRRGTASRRRRSRPAQLALARVRRTRRARARTARSRPGSSGIAAQLSSTNGPARPPTGRAAPRDELLAGPALAGDQHDGDLVARDQRPPRSSRHRVGRRSSSRVSARRAPAGRRYSTRCSSVLAPSALRMAAMISSQLERLLDEVVRAEFMARHRALDRAVRGDDEHLGVGRLGCMSAQQVESAAIASTSRG